MRMFDGGIRVVRKAAAVLVPRGILIGVVFGGICWFVVLLAVGQ